VVERNQPSMKMMQGDTRAKVMKTDRRSKVETRRLRRATFFGKYL